MANVEGDSNYVRVQVLTNAGALDRDKQLAVVREFADLIVEMFFEAGRHGRQQAGPGRAVNQSRSRGRTCRGESPEVPQVRKVGREHAI